MKIKRNKLTAIILAGGMGTRLRSAVSDVPKSMALINGRPFLEYQLDFLLRYGIYRVVLALGYMADVVKHHFGNHWNGMEIHYSHEKTALGTGGAMIKATRIVPDGDTVLAMNGDTYFPVALNKMLEFQAAREAAVLIAMFKSGDADRYSSFSVAPDMRITGIADGAAGLKNGGVYVFSPAIVNDFRERPVQQMSFEADIAPSLLAEGRLIVAYVEPCAFIDIGVPEDYFRAGEIIVNNPV